MLVFLYDKLLKRDIMKKNTLLKLCAMGCMLGTMQFATAASETQPLAQGYNNAQSSDVAKTHASGNCASKTAPASCSSKNATGKCSTGKCSANKTAVGKCSAEKNATGKCGHGKCSAECTKHHHKQAKKMKKVQKEDHNKS
jgi:uncharacterized low-complexity protein